MGTKVSFGGKVIKQPGVYSRILSGVKNPPITADYGKVMIIDNGIGAGFGGGSGIDGALKSGKDAVYRGFVDIDEMREFVKGGILWDLAHPLFRPNKAGANGCSSVDIVRAATTAPAEITFTFTGGGANGGVVVIQLKDEGTVGNGDEDDNDVLRKGYAATMEEDADEADYFRISIWRGTFRGLDPDGNPYGDRPESTCEPELLVVSPAFNNIQTVIDWMDTDKNFQTYFNKKTGTKAGTGAVTAADLANYTGNNLATGGTESYSADRLEEVLQAIEEMDFVFILADLYEADAEDAINLRLLYHIDKEAKFDKFLFVGGGHDGSEFDQTDGSVDNAAAYDHPRAVLIHSGVRKNNRFIAKGYRDLPSIYHAAYALGRTAGLPPQVPVTSKAIDIDGVLHAMTSKQRDKAIDKGVLHTFFDTDYNAFVINQGINTLQNNDNMIDGSGRSYSIQIERIKAQLNREIIVNAKKDLLANPNGVNRNTLSERDVYDWLNDFLATKIATPQADNLIISFQDITVKRIQDYYDIRYGFYPNSEINKLFFTGLILD